jgi:Fe-S-cluster containining protein
MSALLELPDLREGVAALRVPRGVLYHDALRWQVLLVPSTAAPEGARRWLEARGLLAGAVVPKARPRITQVFRVKPGEAPEEGVRLAPGARFSCACCGSSCRGMRLGSILPADAERLLSLAWVGTGHDPSRFFLGADEQPLEGPPGQAAWIELRRVDGACQFLRPDNLCEVHARFGEGAKPAMCRLFPFEFRATEAGLLAGVRLGECVSAEQAGAGAPLAGQEETLLSLHREVAEVALVPPLLWALPGALLRLAEVEALEQRALGGTARAPGGLALALALLDALEARALSPALPAPAPEVLAPLLEAARGDTAAAPQRLPLASAAPRLGSQALALEERIVRASVFAKDAALCADLASGVGLLVVHARLARERACARAAALGLSEVTGALLNDCWKKVAALAPRAWLADHQVSPRAAARAG